MTKMVACFDNVFICKLIDTLEHNNDHLVSRVCCGDGSSTLQAQKDRQREYMVWRTSKARMETTQKNGWFDSACADFPGFLVRGVAGALAPSFRSLRLAPEAAFASWRLRGSTWICCTQLPSHPCKNRTHSTSLSNIRGHTPSTIYANLHLPNAIQTKICDNLQATKTQIRLRVSLSAKFFVFFPLILVDAAPGMPHRAAPAAAGTSSAREGSCPDRAWQGC